MSEIEITDGTGTGYRVKVSKRNRLFSDATILEERQFLAQDGKAFNINTGVMILTSSAKSALLYYKNSSTTHDAIVSKLIYLIGNPTSGSGDSLVTVLKNPTAGTIVTNATDVEMNQNRDFGSSLTFSSLNYKGGVGNDFTNGDKIIESIFGATNTRSAIEVGNIVIPFGKSIGVEYTPPSGTTSQQIEIAMEIYYKEV